MNRLKKCFLSAVKNFRILKIFFFVITVLLLFDELREEFIQKLIFIIYTFLPFILKHNFFVISSYLNSLI